MSRVIKFQSTIPKSDAVSSRPADGEGAGAADFLSFEMLMGETADGEAVGGNIFDHARQESEIILHKAQEEAARIEQEAYNKGFAKGEEEAGAQFAQKINEEVARLNGIFKDLQDQYTSLNKQYVNELLLLIKTMVDRLVNHEVSVNPKVIQACLNKAMEYVIENSMIKVRLSPDDFMRIKEAGFEDPAFLQGSTRVQLIEDPAVSRGGCLLETDFGEIDATLENCKDKLYKAIDEFFLESLALDDQGME